jgi:ABC-2 type transport system permease protein
MRHFTVICQGVFLKDISFYAAMVNLGKIALISVVAVSIAIWMFRRRA